MGTMTDPMPGTSSQVNDRRASLHDIKRLGFVYLATPYSKYPRGLPAAYEDACKLLARLLERGCDVFCPIAHGHGTSTHGGLNALDGAFWTEVDQKHLDRADVLVIAEMEGWQDSIGVQYERDVFEEAGKPVFYLNPVTLEVRQ